jgi:plastocyanin
MMKRLLRLGIFAVLLGALALPDGALAGGLARSNAPQMYTVLVGFENAHQGYDVMGYFPNVVTIHVGDTVHWKINSIELHTVTFLAGSAAPELIVPSALVPGADPNISPVLFNPAVADPAAPAGGMYDGSTYANSGLMGYESWEYQDFSLTFTQAGTYDYICLVHGAIMSGRVVVEDPQESIPTPAQSAALGKKQIAEQLAKVPGVLKAAKAQVKPDVQNPDGSTTHYVTLGYMDGSIDVMQFFPDKVKVSPGDTVVWEMSPSNDAPHTVTFLNGAPSPELVIPAGSLLYLNPETFFPYQPRPELTRSGVYNSGVANPTPGEFSLVYSLKIGDITPGLQPFVCLLHDESGMTGVLMVTPK